MLQVPCQGLDYLILKNSLQIVFGFIGFWLGFRFTKYEFGNSSQRFQVGLSCIVLTASWVLYYVTEIELYTCNVWLRLYLGLDLLTRGFVQGLIFKWVGIVVKFGQIAYKPLYQCTILYQFIRNDQNFSKAFTKSICDNISILFETVVLYYFLNM